MTKYGIQNATSELQLAYRLFSLNFKTATLRPSSKVAVGNHVY